MKNANGKAEKKDRKFFIMVKLIGGRGIKSVLNITFNPILTRRKP